MAKFSVTHAYAYKGSDMHLAGEVHTCFYGKKLDAYKIRVTIIPGHADFKRVEEIKQIVEGYKYPEAERNLVREPIQMLTGDKQ